MANEITSSISVRVANGAFLEMISPGQVQGDQSGVGMYGGTQTIGYAVEQVVSFAGVGTNGRLYLRNLDTTHYVLYGAQLGSAMVVWGKLKPGEDAWCRLAPTVVMMARADSAPVKLDIRLFED